MSKLRLIQCGTGGMGKAWWSSVTSKSPDFDLVAIVDVVPKSLDDAGDAIGIPPDRRFRSLEEAVDKVPADAVLTVTPPVVHAQHAKFAMERGLHVLTEKPIADTLENARMMVRLAAQNQRQLVVGQNYRFRGPIQKLKQLIATQAAGEFGHGHIDFYIPADFTGTFRETMEFPLLVDMAIHHLDLIRCITGRDIVKVTAHTFKPSWSWYQHQPGLKMLIELDGGLPFSYSGDWSALGRSTSWNGNWRLQCSGGSIHLEDDKITIARSERWAKNQTNEAVEAPPLELEGQAALLASFATAIRTGTQAETSGANNLPSFAAVIAGVISAREGRPVNLKELIR
ncbi:Gfo/Idh/MocA family oxidoreductase [soil metagenome]